MLHPRSLNTEDHMSRHIADRRTPTSGEKTRAFLDLDRKSGPHPAVKALMQQPRAPRSGKGLVQFLRIARGRTV